MSKWVEDLPGGGNKITIADEDSCKYEYNEVCCNGYSEYCSYSLREDDCKNCAFYEKEDGVIEE